MGVLMIILSILVFLMGVLCAWMLFVFNEFNFRVRKVQEELDKSMMRESELRLMKAKIQDIADSIVGYEFALKTFEDYMKAKLDK